MNEYATVHRGGPWNVCPYVMKGAAECPELEDAWDPYVDVAVNALSRIFYDEKQDLNLRFEAALYMDVLVSNEDKAMDIVTSDWRLASLLADQLKLQLDKHCGIRDRPVIEDLLSSVEAVTSSLLSDVETVSKSSVVVYAVNKSPEVTSVHAKDDQDESATGLCLEET
eukprot:m.35387 g.35387  ORF g.35387 m.35387 type:complete len:168 (+) comp14416_c0_seq1:446-949(+)